MPGAVDLNENIIRPESAIGTREKAGRDDEGNIQYRYRAGPDAVEAGQAEQVGQFISEEYYKKATKTRKATNQVKRVMRHHDVDESTAREMRQDALDEIEQIREDEDITGEERYERENEIWSELLGTP